MKVRTTIALSLIIILTVILTGCAKKPPVIVNGQAVSQAEFDAEVQAGIKYYQSQLGTDPSQDPQMKQQLMKDVLENVVIKKVVMQEATRRGYKASDKEVAETEKKLVQNWGGEESFNSFVKQQGETRVSLRKQLKEQLLMDKLRTEVTKNINVNEKEAQAYFNQNPDKFANKRQLKVSHILVKSEKEAKDIIKQLEAGGDFSSLAKKYSIDTQTKNNNGDLGWITEDTQFQPSFLEAAMALKAGQFTKTPVSTDYGWHVIKAFEEKAPNSPAYEQVKIKALAEAEKSKKDQAWIKFVDALKKKAKVETNI